MFDLYNRPATAPEQVYLANAIDCGPATLRHFLLHIFSLWPDAEFIAAINFIMIDAGGGGL